MPGVCWAMLVMAIAATPTMGNSAQVNVGQKNAHSVSLTVMGRKLFVNNCSACHGSKGQGGEGPNLHGLALSNAKITSTVTAGINGEMPAFKSKLKAPDIKALIAYIRTLKK